MNALNWLGPIRSLFNFIVGKEIIQVIEKIVNKYIN